MRKKKAKGEEGLARRPRVVEREIEGRMDGGAHSAAPPSAERGKREVGCKIGPRKCAEPRKMDWAREIRPQVFFWIFLGFINFKN